jgi:glyoxylase-like metal-dependent hydrolase (beta-lactamase superfamily II)
VAVAIAQVVGLGLTVVERQLEPGVVAIVGLVHEYVRGLVTDRDAPDLLKAERLVERHAAVDVCDPVARVNQGHGARGYALDVIVERSMNDDFVSNTYVVADEPGGHAVMIDAGGPVAPLLQFLTRGPFELTHVLLTHHHHDHVSELHQVLERHPGTPVLIHELERERVPGATGTMEPGAVIVSGALEIEPIHTPGHTAGMLSLLDHGQAAQAALLDPDPSRPHRSDHGGRRARAQPLRAYLARPGQRGRRALHGDG